MAANDLQRFVDAQDPHYKQILAELDAGEKQSHWMWYVFPQLEGLGNSPMARRYAVANLDEARHYLEHPILGARLVECCEAVLRVPNRSAVEIFGATDAMKLRSSATLFAQVSPAESVFHRIFDRFFGGVADRVTLRGLGGA